MKDALSKIPSRVEDLLKSHAKELETAFANVGKGSLDISFSAKIGMNKHGEQVCEVGISFTIEKIKDSVTFAWNDSQLNLLKMANSDRAMEGRK